MVPQIQQGGEPGRAGTNQNDDAGPPRKVDHAADADHLPLVRFLLPFHTITIVAVFASAPLLAASQQEAQSSHFAQKIAHVLGGMGDEVSVGVKGSAAVFNGFPHR